MKTCGSGNKWDIKAWFEKLMPNRLALIKKVYKQSKI